MVSRDDEPVGGLPLASNEEIAGLTVSILVDQ